MTNLEPEVRIKLIEISREWAEKLDVTNNWETMRKQYLENFDMVYRKLVRTILEK